MTNLGHATAQVTENKRVGESDDRLIDKRASESQKAAPWAGNLGSEVARLHRLDGGLRLLQNGNAVSNRVRALALVAFEALFAAENQRLQAYRAGEHFQHFRRKVHGEIVAGSCQMSAISRQPRAIAPE